MCHGGNPYFSLPGVSRPVHDVLWAEDNPKDQVLIQAALEDVPAAPKVRFVSDGLLLLQALEGSLPDLVVLDLKMPRVGGLEALRRMRGTPRWSGLPVVIFSAGDNPEETQACYGLGARGVVQKPVSFQLFAEAVQRIVAGLPGPPRLEAAPSHAGSFL
jgi:CheY-like chemotaxis protein